MPGIGSEFISHHLATFLDIQLVAQKRRNMSPNRAQEVQKHIQALLDASLSGK